MLSPHDGRYVVKLGPEWEFQSLLSDLLRFKALNTALPTLPGRDRGQVSVDAALARHVGMNRAQASLVLELLHGERPDANRSVGADWIPVPLQGCAAMLVRLPPRHCPVCILTGFHSPMWQLPWITHCPLHFERLQVPLGPLFTRKAQGHRHPYGLSGPDPIQVARHSLSEGQLRLVARYREFVSASRHLEPIPVLMYRTEALSDVHSWVPQSSQYSVDPSPGAIQLINVAAGVIAQYLGFRDLVERVMRTPMPSTDIVSVDMRPDRVPRSTPPRIFRSVRRQMRFRRSNPGSRRRQRTMRSRLVGEGRHLQVFRSQVVEMLSSHLHCQSATACATGARDEAESHCLLCRGLTHWHRWTRGISVGRSGSPEATVLQSPPRCRRFEAPTSEVANKMQSRLMVNDFAEHLAAVLRRETLDGMLLADERVQHAIRSGTELFNRFVAIRDRNKALLIVWDEPNLVEMMRALLADCAESAVRLVG